MTGNKIRVVFFGSPAFAAHCLQALLSTPWCSVCAVVTQPDKPAGRGGKLSPVPVKELAQSVGIPTLTPQSIRKNLATFRAELSAHGDFDIGIVVAFGQILPQEILDTPRRGCINTHASLLPRWRGAAPIQRAILAGDTETGVCLMKMEAGLDTGPVFSTDRLPIETHENAGSLHDKLADCAALMLIRDLPAIVEGSITPCPQSDRGVTYASKITNDEPLLDWQRSAIELERTVRAFCPSPGSFTWFRGRRLKILTARAQAPLGSLRRGNPGSIAAHDRQRLEVWCGDGCLSLHEVQPEGKRRMQVDEFLQGAHLQGDEVFTGSAPHTVNSPS